MTPSEDTLFDILRDAALEADDRELGTLEHDTPLDALELDSVAMMQVIAHFEDRLDCRLPAQQFARARTVGEFFEVIRRGLALRGAEPVS